MVDVHDDVKDDNVIESDYRSADKDNLPLAELRRRGTTQNKNMTPHGATTTPHHSGSEDDDDNVHDSISDGGELPRNPNNFLQQLIQQNQLLLEALVGNTNAKTQDVSSNRGMQVMLDLSKETAKFNGESGTVKARYWLKDVKSKKSLHFWTDEICLQLAQTHLTDGAKR